MPLASGVLLTRYDEPGLRLTIKTTHSTAGTPLLIEADLHGYRGIPPAWRFLDPDTRETAGVPFPQPGPAVDQRIGLP
jgi:hypothetical protein